MAIEFTPAVTQLRSRAGSEGMGQVRPLEAGKAGDKSFSDFVTDAIDSVDEAQKTADQQIEDIIVGKSGNIHEAMISMEKAQLSFQLLMEVRNKAVDTYKELSRMQV